MTSKDAVRERLRALDEPIQDRLGRTNFVSQEEFVRTAQCCANCVFYVRNGGYRDHNGQKSYWDETLCKRSPPALIQTVEGNRAAWPETEWGDWCGEHKAIEGFGGATAPEPIQVEGFRQD